MAPRKSSSELDGKHVADAEPEMLSHSPARPSLHKIYRARRNPESQNSAYGQPGWLKFTARVVLIVVLMNSFVLLVKVLWPSWAASHISIRIRACGNQQDCHIDDVKGDGKLQATQRMRWRGPLPRNTSKGIRQHGSVFGFFKMKLNCPAAPQRTYQPTVFWEGGMLTEIYSQADDGNSPPDLLIGILSSCHSRDRRDVVRETWLRLVPPAGMTWMARFVVSSECKVKLESEQHLYNDLLFVDVKDSYFTLTRRVLMFFDYAHAVGAKYTMKTDDDSYVFPDRILQEIKKMPEGKCLYWGQANRLPDGRKYKQTVLAVPLHKWYIPRKQYLTLLEQTLYMQGGGYILSRDLVANVAAREEDPPDHLPEDAIVARMVGNESVKNCMCSDSRMIKEAYSFQNIDLFRSSTMACERADIAHRTLNIHGIRNIEDMRTFHREGVQPLVPCDVSDRQFTGPEYRQLWGHSQLPKKAAQEYSLGEGPTFTREYRIYNLLKGKKQRTYNDHQLVPLPVLTKNREMDKKIPWCIRLEWTSQLIDLLLEMKQQRRLLCNLVRSSIFVNATDLHLWVDRGPAPVQLQYENHTRLHAGRWCFADELCQTCFLTPSKDFLDSGKCDMKTHRCVGYDSVSMAQVLIHKVIKPLFDKNKLPNVPRRKFLLQIHHILERVMKVKKDSRRPEPQDPIVDRLYRSFKGMQDAYQGQIGRCLKSSHQPLVGMLTSMIAEKLETDRQRAEQEAQGIMDAATDAALHLGQHEVL